MSLVVATFYKFVRLPDAAEWQDPLRQLCHTQGIRGTILLAHEGINATLAGSRSGIDAVLQFLCSDPRLADLQVKESSAPSPPFDRMKVRLKREIVTLGLPSVNPNDHVGIYVPPSDWNTLITDPSVTVIDTRNRYEVAIGTFQGACNPETHSFRDFPDFVRTHLNPQQHRKLALFCTGGIRCEKATSFLRQEGFPEVYHLEGGILKYLEEIPAAVSLWQGECYVFDQRISLQSGLALGSYDYCWGCGHPLSDQDKMSPGYEPGICCSYCVDQLTPEKRARQIEKVRQFQIKPSIQG